MFENNKRTETDGALLRWAVAEAEGIEDFQGPWLKSIRLSRENLCASLVNDASVYA